MHTNELFLAFFHFHVNVGGLISLAFSLLGPIALLITIRLLLLFFTYLLNAKALCLGLSVRRLVGYLFEINTCDLCVAFDSAWSIQNMR